MRAPTGLASTAQDAQAALGASTAPHSSGGLVQGFPNAAFNRSGRPELGDLRRQQRHAGAELDRDTKFHYGQTVHVKVRKIEIRTLIQEQVA